MIGEVETGVWGPMLERAVDIEEFEEERDDGVHPEDG